MKTRRPAGQEVARTLQKRTMKIVLLGVNEWDEINACIYNINEKYNSYMSLFFPPYAMSYTSQTNAFSLLISDDALASLLSSTAFV